LRDQYPIDFRFPVFDSLNPIVSVLDHLGRAEFAAKSAGYLSVIMAFKAKRREVREIIIRGVVIDVVNLHSFSRNVADTAGPVLPKQDFGHEIIRNNHTHRSGLVRLRFQRRTSDYSAACTPFFLLFSLRPNTGFKNCPV
jgi:hypothetical protein